MKQNTGTSSYTTTQPESGNKMVIKQSYGNTNLQNADFEFKYSQYREGDQMWLFRDKFWPFLGSNGEKYQTLPDHGCPTFDSRTIDSKITNW